MAIIQIILVLFLVLYIITREVWIIFKKQDKVCLEIHFPIFAINFQSKSDGREKRSKDSKNKLPFLSNIRIFSAVIDKLSTNIIVEKLVIPFPLDELIGSGISGHVTRQFIIFSLIAYLRTKSKNIIIDNNAFILSPDSTKTLFYLTAKPKIINLIIAILTYLVCLMQEKKRIRMVRNVRE